MIQDIFPHTFDNQYAPNKTIEDSDYIFHYNENALLWKIKSNEFDIPQKKDIPALNNNSELNYLFSFNHKSCFLLLDDIKKIDDTNFIYQEPNFFREVSQELGWISLVAFHLMTWYSNNKFCGKCGTPTQHKKDERAMICTNCNTVIYPKISPAIIVAIICNDKILLARNSHFKGGWYSLIAGFTDIGETLEETVIREVKEEVGLDVKNIRYHTSQPWPLSGSMMIGFIAEADDSQPIQIDDNEIAEAAWFKRGSLPQHSSTISISGEIIERFEKGEL